MLEIYFLELRRFRTAALIYGIANLLILTVIEQLADIPNEMIEVHLGALILYMLSGLGFALYQFGTYRQPNRWIWLMHRPMHRARIMGAIVLAAVTLMALTIVVPLFAVMASQAHYTVRVVEWRHYAGAAYLALSALSAWLAGGYVVLHRSRWAFVILVLPVILTMRLATATTVIGLSLGCNALLLFLLYTVFRPDRKIGDEVMATVASAVPMQVSFYLALVWGGSLLFQIGQMVAGVYPLSSDHVPRGGYIEADRSYADENIQAVLATSTDPRAAAWRAGLDRHTTVSVSPKVRQYAVHNLMTTLGAVMFNDDANHWTYSHDRMMYRGVTRRGRRDKGWLGAGDDRATAFDAQPSIVYDNRKTIYLVNARDMYELIPARSILRPVLHVDGSEQLAGGIALLGQRKLVLTNRRLLVLDPTGKGPATAAGIALPMPFGDLERIDAAPVANGTLVSFLYGYRQLKGVANASQILYLVDDSGHVQEVGRRELNHDFPLLFEHKDWWVSPALYSLVELPDLLVDNGTVPDDGASRFSALLRPRPAGVWIAAIAAALLSAAGALWWTRRTNMAPGVRLVWFFACLLLGVPALLSLTVLKPRARLKTSCSTPASLAPA